MNPAPFDPRQWLDAVYEAGSAAMYDPRSNMIAFYYHEPVSGQITDTDALEVLKHQAKQNRAEVVDFLKAEGLVPQYPDKGDAE